MNLLVVESDFALGAFLRQEFGAQHQLVDMVPDGKGAGLLAQSRAYDAAVFDLDASEVGSIETLHGIRSARPQLPILALARCISGERRAEILDAGADDVLTKPFAFAELSARVRVVARRGGARTDTVRVHDLELNRAKRTVTRAGRVLELTPREFALLDFLMCHKGECVTRAQIVETAWNQPGGAASNIVDVYINYLRKKLDANIDRKLIHTVRGMGYIVREEGMALKSAQILSRTPRQRLPSHVVESDQMLAAGKGD